MSVTIPRAFEAGVIRAPVERDLLVYSAMGGAYLPLMAFALLPSVLIVALLSIDKLGWGWRFLARACAGMAVTCAS